MKSADSYDYSSALRMPFSAVTKVLQVEWLYEVTALFRDLRER